METIKIIGAREHNLKNINLEIPKNKLIVFTGLSGSGKSTLAFDTLYAEGQRRYIESLSSYARQFLDRVGKPDIDHIDGLTPAIAIDQKSTSKNPRSTVGTITEIYDYLRLLYARIGTQHCPKCGKKVSKMSASDIIEQILKLPQGAKITILSPVIRDKKGSFVDILESLRARGFVRAMIDGVMVRLDEEIELSKTKKHTIKVVIDRALISEENSARIADDVEKGLHESFGEIELEIANATELGLESSHIHFSEHNACFDCKISFNALEPLSFSFNSLKGACQACDGLGIRFSLDLDKIIDENLSINDGAIKVMYGFNKSYYYKFLVAFCEQNGIDINLPYIDLSDEDKRLVLYGNAKSINFVWKHHRIKKSFDGVLKIAYEMLKDDRDFNEYTTEKVCESCSGNRLNPDSLAVRVAGKGIGEIINMSIESLTKFFQTKSNFSHLNPQESLIAEPILKEINERLYFLYDVGLFILLCFV